MLAFEHNALPLRGEAAEKLILKLSMQNYHFKFEMLNVKFVQPQADPFSPANLFDRGGQFAMISPLWLIAVFGFIDVCIALPDK